MAHRLALAVNHRCPGRTGSIQPDGQPAPDGARHLGRFPAVLGHRLGDYFERGDRFTFAFIAAFGALFPIPMPTEIYEQLRELFQRVTVLEQDIKRHEQIALIIIAILGGLGWLSYVKIMKWVKEFIAAKVVEGLAQTIKNAENELAANHATVTAKTIELQRLIESAAIYDELMKKKFAAVPGAPEYMIQFGEDNVTFNNTSYLAFEVKFPKEFPVVPKVFVGEAHAGAWLVVKVDDKDTKKFKWAANNLLGVSTYQTLIQWVAFAEIPKPVPNAEEIRK